MCRHVIWSQGPPGLLAGRPCVHPGKKPQACPSHFLALLSPNSLTTSGAKFLPSEASGQLLCIFPPVLEKPSCVLP